MIDYFGEQLLSCSDSKDFEDYSRLLIKQLADAYDDYEPLKTFLGSPGHKWRVTSAWQKAVRRGDTFTALRMVNALWEHEPKYVMYRLPVILLEDVGWGNPGLLLAGMFICNHQKWMMDNSSPKKVMYMITKLACESVKDRSTCDVTVTTDRLFSTAPAIKDIFLMGSLEDRLAILADETHTDPMKRMAALWSIAGTSSYEGGVMTPYAVKKPVLREIVEGFHPIAQYAWKVGSSRMKDGMPLAALITFNMIENAEKVWVDDQEWLTYPADEKLGNYPGSTFDWHVQEGKASIAYFLKACPPWAEWLGNWILPSDKKSMIAATARFLFRVESGVVDKRLLYEPWSEFITKETIEAAASAHGIPASHVEQGKELLKANLPMLNYARSRVLGLDTIAKPEVVSL